MTSLEYARAKYIIAAACNDSGLQPADIVCVLSAVIAEAREQMCFELASENIDLQNELSTMKEKEDGNS